MTAASRGGGSKSNRGLPGLFKIVDNNRNVFITGGSKRDVDGDSVLCHDEIYIF